MIKKIHLFQKWETSIEAGGVTRDENSVYGWGWGWEIQIQEIQIDGLKSQLNNKPINLIGKKF